MSEALIDLPAEISKNNSSLAQLRYFERNVATRQRIAQANTYISEAYQDFVLNCYSDYLSHLETFIRLREEFDQLLAQAGQMTENLAEKINEYQQRFDGLHQGLTERFANLTVAQAQILTEQLDLENSYSRAQMEEEEDRVLSKRKMQQQIKPKEETPAAPTQAPLSVGSEEVAQEQPTVEPVARTISPKGQPPQNQPK